MASFTADKRIMQQVWGD